MKRIRSWRWMARRRWRWARSPREVCTLETLLPRVSAMGGRIQSGEAVFVVEGWLEFMVETEPRGFVKSKPGGAMKSSAAMPGAIW
jgi:hypothetical protein